MEFYGKPPTPTLPANSKHDGCFYCEKHSVLVYGQCNECIVEPEKARCNKCSVMSFEKDLEWDRFFEQRLCYYCRVQIGMDEMLNKSAME